MTGSHGLGRDTVAATWPALTASELAPVLDSYGLHSPSPRWHSPRPWSTAAIVDTATVPVFVKRHATSLRRTGDLTSEHAFSDHLLRNGFSTPAVLRRHDGASVFATDGWRYEVFALASGDDAYRDRLSWTPYRDTAEAGSAGELLAALHRTAASYPEPPRGGPAGLGNALGVLARSELPSEVLAWIHRRPTLVAFLRDRSWEGDISEALREPHKALCAILPAQRAQWGHGDWHGSNVCWDAGQAVGAIDLGMADRTCVAFDLAIALERSGFEWLDLLDGRSPTIHGDQIAAFLAGYASASAEPLGKTAEAVARFLPIAHVPLAMAELDFYTRVNPDPVNAQYAYAYLVGHARWFSAEGRGALEQIAALG